MTYNEILAATPRGAKPVIVLFYGAACAPCEQLKPVLRAVAKSCKTELHELNSANEMEALRALGARQVPFVAVVEAGEGRMAFSGALDAETIRSKLSERGVIQPFSGGDIEIDANNA